MAVSVIVSPVLSVYGGGNPVTASFTTVAGGNCLVMLGKDEVTVTPTFNGVALTVAVAAGTSWRPWIYYLINPPVGTYTASVECSGANQRGFAVLELAGVNPASPIGNTQTGFAGAPPISVTVTGMVTGDLCLDCIGGGGADTPPTIGADQSSIMNRSNISFQAASYQSETGGVMSWSAWDAGESAYMVAANFRQFPGGNQVIWY